LSEGGDTNAKFFIDNVLNSIDKLYAHPTPPDIPLKSAVATMTFTFNTMQAEAVVGYSGGADDAGNTPPPGGGGGQNTIPSLTMLAWQAILPQTMLAYFISLKDTNLSSTTLIKGALSSEYIVSMLEWLEDSDAIEIAKNEGIEDLTYYFAGILISLGVQQGTYQHVGAALGSLFESNPALFSALLSDMADIDLPAALQSSYSFASSLPAGSDPNNASAALYKAFEAKKEEEDFWVNYITDLALLNPTLAYGLLKKVASGFGKSVEYYLNKLKADGKWKELGALLAVGDFELLKSNLPITRGSTVLVEYLIGAAYTQVSAENAVKAIGSLDFATYDRILRKMTILLNNPDSNLVDVKAVARIILRLSSGDFTIASLILDQLNLQGFIGLLSGLDRVTDNHSNIIRYLIISSSKANVQTILTRIASKNPTLTAQLFDELYLEAMFVDYDIQNLAPSEIMDIFVNMEALLRLQVFASMKLSSSLREVYINERINKQDLYAPILNMTPSEAYSQFGPSIYTDFLLAYDLQTTFPFFVYLLLRNNPADNLLAASFFSQQPLIDQTEILSSLSIENIQRLISELLALRQGTWTSASLMTPQQISGVLRGLGPHISRRVLTPPTAATLEIITANVLPEEFFKDILDISSYGLAQGETLTVPVDGGVLFSSWDGHYSLTATPIPGGATTEFGHPAAMLTLTDNQTGSISTVSSEPIGLGATLSINDHGALIYSSDSGATSVTILPGSDTPTQGVVLTIINGEAVLYDPATGRIWDSSKGPYTPPPDG
ncbi:MAG: hypothetical protein AAF228_13265, partial [Pseudomonadota bacterium]